MSEELKFFVNDHGTYLGAMGGELLPDSPHPYPAGVELDSAPESMTYRWDFAEKVWLPPEDTDAT